ncbi:ubiquitin carboxyl-terminal hydrolase 5 [Eutrema salsugineum]|uniref:ubiquitin carboxyl-terminal hydrolase 5 n=1 Tax=Eutrema salsugineum TaxID=72664 RepID=UPI000CED6F0C|nr:ubiquitin carboxyl-terminal hydrolase 5 [Eutrema salsugineum]
MAEVSMGSSSGSMDLSPEEERVFIRDIAIAAEANSKEGDTFYLITQRWWQEWIEYVNQDQPCNTNDGSSLSEHCDSAGSSTLKKPSMIDNSDLIYESALEDPSNACEIIDTLQEGRDYVLLPQEVWNQLRSWYGGGPTLARRVISSGLSQTELAVEVYPLRLQLLLMPKSDHSAIRISKKETIRELHRRACEIFDLNSEHVHIWDYYGHQKYSLMNDLDRTLDDANLQMDQDILVEMLDINGTTSSAHIQSVQENGLVDEDSTSILIDPSKSSLSVAGGFSSNRNTFRSGSVEVSQSFDSTYSSTGVTTRGSTAGLTGLLNLGNTCFMNSAIQCLVHTPEFASYFQEDYHQEINWQNPLGMVGELALAFGDLLRKLWAPGRTPIAPRPFKAKLARFAPQFSGYNQHDSQELLAFLLDGLHEDLNRVKHKPYINSRDADGRPDEEVADEFWANHIARNDSIIVDVCQGQYKSTLVCPICNKVSVTFDPFMYLSLPLQFNTTRAITVTVFSCDKTALPSTITINVSKQGRCRDLMQALTSACFLKPSEELKLAEIRNNLIHRLFEDPLIPLSTIKDDDHLAAYKLSKSSENTALLRLVLRRRDQKAGERESTVQLKPYGTPLLSLASRENALTKGKIHCIVQNMLSPFRREESMGKKGNIDSSIPERRSARFSNSEDEDKNGGLRKVKKGSSSEVGASKLSLQLMDENNRTVNLPDDEGEAIKLPPSATVIVYLDWTVELSGIYDITCLESLPEVLKYGPATKKARSEPLSLYACLEAFLREEPLVPDEMWFCPQCNERRQASKKLDLWRLPEVLVIHLKRFSYSRSMKHKLETFVNFPIHDLDLTKYVANKNLSRPQLYELYALTNHYGGMGSGHYTAHIKLLDDNRWYNFDDSHISHINEDDVKSGAAYVLFYRRKSDDAGGKMK